MPPSINFRFIRKGETTARDDDYCTVKKNGDAFTLSFSWRDSQDKLVGNKATVTADGVCRWVRRAIDMVTRDTEPFGQFQVDYPLIPSVIFDVANLEDHYHAILDAVEFSVDNWPGETKATLSQTFSNIRSNQYATGDYQAGDYQAGDYQAGDYQPDQYTSLNQTVYPDNVSVSTTSSMPPLVRTGVQTRSQARRHLFFDDV